MLTVVLALSACVGYSQEAVEVTTQQFTIGGQTAKEFWLGFAAGDKIVFNCEETKNREIAAIEIYKYPDNTAMFSAKAKKVENKIIEVPEDAAYLFSFKSSGTRSCAVHIQRIPASEDTKRFNTTITKKMIEKRDTIYEVVTEDVIVGYDTTYEEKRVRLLEDMTRISEDPILEKDGIEVPKKSQKIVVPFTIPKQESMNFPGQSKEFVAWVYWIGVGKESQKEWNKNVNAMKNLAEGVASLTGLGPLEGIAIGAITDIVVPTKSDAVAYRIYRENEQDKDTLSHKVTLAYGKELEQKAGTYFIELENDKKMRAITVDVKISMIWETKYYEVEKVQKITPRIEKKKVRKPKIRIRTTEVPVLAQ